MSQPNSPIAHIYNPMNQDRQALIDSFVVRQKELNRIFREIRTSGPDQVSQNFIIQGQRGTGKTTLLARIKYAIEDDKSLEHLIPVQFTEEQYNIFSLNRLWENTADILEEEPGFETLVPEMEELDDDDDFFYPIKRMLKQNKKKLVLLIDNFGDVLKKLPEKAHKKLRDLLHETDLQIIAGSTRALETTYKHDKPFFESFKTIMLTPLTREDVQVLLQNLCNRYQDKKAFHILKNEKGRIETIRRLTGGVPRTIILLFEIFLDDSANVFEDLEGILDKITPLYKHKMDDLPTQQQVIVDAIALNWDGMLTSEIAKKTKLETKKVAAQMKVLERNGLIASVKVNKKNKLYMLDERFFNIWYLMRYGRKRKRQQVKWLVSFLNDWCSREELVKRAQSHITLAKEGKLHERGAYFMAEALSQTVNEPILQYEVLSNTRAMLEIKAPDLAENLSNADHELLICATKACDTKDIEACEKCLRPLVEKGNVQAMYHLALLFHHDKKKLNSAEKFYLMAIENENKYTPAMLNLISLYCEAEKHDKVKKYGLQFIETDFKDNLSLSLLIGTVRKQLFNIEQYASPEKLEHVIFLAVAAIHRNDFKASREYFKGFLQLADNFIDHQTLIVNYMILLIIRKQYHLALELLDDSDFRLKKIVKPIYYALLSLMRDEFPKEYKRMGDELKETVEEIMESIRQLAEIFTQAENI